MKYTKQQQEEVKHFLEFLDTRTGIKNLEFSNADVITDMQEEIERLNNIINELEKELKNRIKNVPDTMVEVYEDESILNKLQELKGADKE